MTSLTLKDCAFTLQMGGVRPVFDLADLTAALQACSADCLYHHFCHPLLRRHLGESEFPNDLATWAARELRDRVLAERLAILNPFTFEGIDSLRSALLEVVGRRQRETEAISPPRAALAFRFIRSVTVVFSTGVELGSCADFLRALGEIGNHSLYYHFIEARTANGRREDDFITWLATLPGTSPELISTLRDPDFYFMTLDEIRQRLRQILGDR